VKQVTNVVLHETVFSGKNCQPIPGQDKLPAGSLYVVPKGMRHNPVAKQECHIMLLKKKQTLHTGEVVLANTRSLTEQLRPL
jgi:hypothetical protein